MKRVMLTLFLSVQSSPAQWVQTNGPDGGEIHALAVSGSNLFAGTSSGIFLSTDNGSSWTAINTGLTNVSTQAFVFSGSNLFAGTFGGVFLSTNNGANWTAVNSGLTYYHVLALAFNGGNLFAGTDGGGVYLSTDNGTLWTDVNSGMTSSSILTLVVNDTDIFAGTHGGIFRSTNNGTTWTAVNSGVTSTTVLSLAVSSTNIFAGTWGGIFLSTNNGTNWSRVHPGLTDTAVYSLAVNGTDLFAGTGGGGVFLSTNNGATWATANSGLTNTNVRAFAVSGANIFAGTYGGMVFSAAAATLPVEITGFRVIVEGSEVQVIWRTETEVNNYGFGIERRVTNREPAKWDMVCFVIGSGTSSSPNDYSFLDHDLFPGTYRYRIKQIDRDGSFSYHGDLQVEIVGPGKFTLGQNFPNPFNPITTIRYSLPTTSNVRLTIYNMLGQVMSKLVNEQQSAGWKEVQWDATGVASGLFFYKLQAGNFVEVKKMLVVR